MGNGKIKAWSALSLAVLFLGTAFGNYCFKLEDCGEMTFISNAVCGIILLIGGILLIKGRDLPHFMYLNCAVLMMSVVCVCGMFAPGVCFKGASILPHLITPFALLLFYMLFCDGRKSGKIGLITATVIPTAYFIIMTVVCRTTGTYVYEYFDPNAYSAYTLVLIGLAAELMVVALAAVLQFTNKALRTVIHGRHGAHDSAEKA